MTRWLRERKSCWPLTRNPHLLVTRHTAVDTAGPPIAPTVLDAIFGDLGLTPSQVLYITSKVSIHGSGS